MKTIDFLENYLYVFYRVMNGHFGKKVLKQPYKKIWCCLTWSCLFILFFVFIFCPIIEAWGNFIDFVNYVRWGIK